MTTHLILDHSLWLKFAVPVGVDRHDGTPSVQLRKAARREASRCAEAPAEQNLPAGSGPPRSNSIRAAIPT
jgi:hypothetical protein